MGFFSWLTSDTKESIVSRYADHYRQQDVYLLQPGKKKNIKESRYEGYGCSEALMPMNGLPA